MMNPSTPPKRVLVVDDDPDTIELMGAVLSDQFEVLTANEGLTAIMMAKTHQPDVILLDINMPRMNGILVCDRLRTELETRNIPVLMLSGMDDLNFRILSFNSGADDFISKPFHKGELVARINSKIRRTSERAVQPAEKSPDPAAGVVGPSLIRCGNLLLNPDKIEARVNDRVIALSLLEFNLLKYFATNIDRVVSRKKILQDVWKDAVVTDRTVDAHIVSLRKRLAGCDFGLSTVYGAGYIFKSKGSV